MNKKIIIAILALLIIVCAGAFAMANSSSDASVSIDANSLEDRGNLVVDSESLDESNGLYHTDSSDVNTILVKNGGALKLLNSIINRQYNRRRSLSRWHPTCRERQKESLAV